MAKIRDIKKDINSLMHEVIDECYAYLEYSHGINFENVSNIITDAVEVRNQLIHRLTHFDFIPDHAKIKEHYRNIINDLYDKNIELIERLNSLNE